MPQISQVTATWNGFAGTPSGISRFNFEDLVDAVSRQAAVDAVRAWFNALVTLWRTTWTIQVSQLIQNYDVQTSKLMTEASAGTQPQIVTGGNAGNIYAGGVGCVVRWNTNLIWAGRHLTGRTFLVPCVNAMFDTDGTLLPATITTINNANVTLLANANAHLVVWGKRFAKNPDGTPVKPPQQTDGNASRVITGVAQDRSAVMRSRRT